MASSAKSVVKLNVPIATVTNLTGSSYFQSAYGDRESN